MYDEFTKTKKIGRCPLHWKWIKIIFGSGALPGFMLDLGLLKIICEEFSFLFLVPVGSTNPAGPILIPFLALRGKAKLYLT